MPGRILVKTLDGKWETLGTDRDPGNEPYGIAPSWNDLGPDTLAFNIRRDPAVEHPDLASFAPIRYYPDAVDRPTWAGFLLERPGGNESDPSIAGQARGWQYHLDDDLYERLLVHSDVTAWQDVRSIAGAWLAQFVTGPQVITGQQVSLLWPPNVGIVNNSTVGVLLDFGPNPDCWPVRLEASIETTAAFAGSPSFTVYLRAADEPAAFTVTGGGVLGVTFDEFTNSVSTSGAVDLGGTIATARRYVSVFLYRNGATVAAGAATEAGIRITGLRAYRKTAYAVANASVLKVSDIIEDALPLAPLLDQATDLITDTALNIPHSAWLNEPKTPREVITGWNAYHGYLLRLGGPSLNKIEFRPQPARALLKVDTSEPGARFADASTSSGSDVYNRVLVRGRSGSGVELEVERLASNLEGLARAPAVGLQPSNPSADVDASSWTGLPGVGGAVTVTRDTGVFTSAPGSIKIAQGAAFTKGAGVSAAFAAGGIFRAGVTYVLAFNVRLDYSGGSNPGTFFYFGVFGSDYASGGPGGTSGVFEQVTIAWTPRVDVAANLVTFRSVRSNVNPIIPFATVTAQYFDELLVTIGAANAVDRRGFRRAKVLEIGSPTDEVAMSALGDAWLGLHRTTPLKGSLEISSDTAVTELASGRAVPADELGLYVGEYVHLANLIDPDTGELSRNGKIAGVSGTGTVAVTIDNQRTAFDALLARMAVVAK